MVWMMGYSAAERVAGVQYQAHPAHKAGVCWLVELGFRPYRESMEIQNRIVSWRKQGRIPDCLLLVEYPATITLGKAGDLLNLLASEQQLSHEGIEFFRTDRGGDITFHGPGQLVAYPIVDLKSRGRDVAIYLRLLESCLIHTLQDFGIDSGRIPGLTGVWIGDQKVAAIGVRTSQWVTSHGLALNINTDMRYFAWIVPCGQRSKGVTSMHLQLGRPVSFQRVRGSFCHHFEATFNVGLQSVEPDAILDPSYP